MKIQPSAASLNTRNQFNKGNRQHDKPPKKYLKKVKPVVQTERISKHSVDIKV